MYLHELMACVSTCSGGHSVSTCNRSSAKLEPSKAAANVTFFRNN